MEDSRGTAFTDGPELAYSSFLRLARALSISLPLASIVAMSSRGVRVSTCATRLGLLCTYRSSYTSLATRTALAAVGQPA